MANINLHTIEGIVIAECPSCGDDSAFLYLGVQKGYQELPSFVLYNCFECGSTRAHTSLLED